MDMKLHYGVFMPMRPNARPPPGDRGKPAVFGSTVLASSTLNSRQQRAGGELACIAITGLPKKRDSESSGAETLLPTFRGFAGWVVVDDEGATVLLRE
jgi:hypothetical protein